MRRGSATSGAVQPPATVSSAMVRCAAAAEAPSRSGGGGVPS
ncbi:hypothetical protein [Sphingomonas sp. BK580]|nr:hypothetical protein [Sphingomonas sp. BK580]MBB3694536.1 hypothetical protein [Sphingomonas sp. BK580]